MNAKVVDTNVAIAANGRSTHADEKCQLASILALKEIVKEGVLLIDELELIINEYRAYLNHSGMPGVGDLFYKHVFNNKYNPERCIIVKITEKDDGSTSFEEYPSDTKVQSFDIDDHKFVAVANSYEDEATILNSLDSDWVDYEAEFNRLGINIEQLCPHQVSTSGT